MKSNEADGSRSAVRSIVTNLKEYGASKRIRGVLERINPMLNRGTRGTIRTTDLQDQLWSSVERGWLSIEEYHLLEAKIGLGTLCSELERCVPDAKVTILFYDDAENKIYHGAAPSIPLAFFDFFQEINEKGSFDDRCGSCGFAIHRRRAVYTDIGVSELWEGLREHAAAFGFRSAWSYPFYLNDTVAGTFAFYFEEDRREPRLAETRWVRKKLREYERHLERIANMLSGLSPRPARRVHHLADVISKHWSV